MTAEEKSEHNPGTPQPAPGASNGSPRRGTVNATTRPAPGRTGKAHGAKPGGPKPAPPPNQNRTGPGPTKPPRGDTPPAGNRKPAHPAAETKPESTKDESTETESTETESAKAESAGTESATPGSAKTVDIKTEDVPVSATYDLPPAGRPEDQTLHEGDGTANATANPSATANPDTTAKPNATADPDTTADPGIKGDPEIKGDERTKELREEIARTRTDMGATAAALAAKADIPGRVRQAAAETGTHVAEAAVESAEEAGAAIGAVPRRMRAEPGKYALLGAAVAAAAVGAVLIRRAR